MIRKRAKGKRSAIRYECDRLWQQIISLLFKGRCAHCGGTWACAGHHNVGRSVLATRYGEMNGMYLCCQCHRWAEEHQLHYRVWLKEKYPDHFRYWTLNRHRIPVPVSLMELQEARVRLKKRLKELQ